MTRRISRKSQVQASLDSLNLKGLKCVHRKLAGFQFQLSSLKACRDSFGSRLALFVETISANGLTCFVLVNELIQEGENTQRRVLLTKYDKISKYKRRSALDESSCSTERPVFTLIERYITVLYINTLSCASKKTAGRTLNFI